MDEDAPFLRLGPDSPVSPVILSVPHAGRHYPPPFETLSRVPASRLTQLEDRYADRLVERAVNEGAVAIVAQTARAWIDLNRAEREFDPKLVAGGEALAPVPSAKVRGGLGVVPRRLAREGELWRGPISAAHLAERLERHHRPYHDALTREIQIVLDRFGLAVLVDLHSMPPLPAKSDKPSHFVVGDLFGRSAHARFSHAALAALGDKTSLNSPYAGGHILERHGQPRRGIHALQVEIDRSLYLDTLLDQPGQGLTAMQQAIARLLDALAEEALGAQLLAAE